MGDHEVPVPLQLARVELGVAVVDLPVLRRESECGLPWRALCIIFVTLKNSSRPIRICQSHSRPDVAHQRDERVEDLGHAAAHGGRVEVQDPLARERLGELVDLLDQGLAGEVPVVGYRLVADANGL